MSEVPQSGTQGGPQAGPQAGSQPQAGPQGGPRPPAGPAGGSAGRYQRSTSGLIGALLVTLLVILGFVGFRALNRNNPDVHPTRVDYLSAVDAAQQSGFKVVYPPSLPSGWLPDSIHMTPGDRPAWGMGMLTADGRFAGIRQEDAPLDELLKTYVDENPSEGPKVHIDSPVASTWQSFSDSGGDHAYAADVGRDVVLVYGSASTDDLRRLVGDLSTAPRARQ